MSPAVSTKPQGFKHRRGQITTPRFRTFTKFPQGPRLYHQPSSPNVAGGFGMSPPGFIMATNSETEWMVYWALGKVLVSGWDPRQPPFIGHPPDFLYQEYSMGGRSEKGGAVIDFFLPSPPPFGVPLGIRLGTEFFHFAAPPGKQASDEMQFALLARSMNIIDINDYTFTSDKTGQAVIQKVKDVIGLIRMPDPIAYGITQRNRV